MNLVPIKLTRIGPCETTIVDELPEDNMGFHCPSCSAYIMHTAEEWEDIYVLLRRVFHSTQDQLDLALADNIKLRQEIPLVFAAGREFALNNS